ncbi:O-antigen ligase family protein [Curvibacter sp. RS43]|uniref:O-antigen ligase family protein n=1 Tax=Curvibacter microcysteis TaxID=3026419 RepID=UPI002362DECD|nr:O-antigen ligase family protein [Curvibacter sp. RS43]MDD0811219.1 O-antigen ligase family protein [Curvibacter sp. RS43]
MQPTSPSTAPPGPVSAGEWSPAERASSLAAFALPALSLCLPSGYSWGATLLLFASLLTVRHWWHRPPDWAQLRWLVAALVFMGLDWLVDAVISQGSWRGLDKPLKYFLALPCLFFVLRYPPRPRALWAGLAVGASLSGLVSLYQYLVQGMWRTEGFTNAIQYGNLSLLMAVMCLVGAMMWPEEPRRLAWRLALGVGMVLGLVASLLSQARGGWLSLLFILPVLVFLVRRYIPLKRLLLAMAALGLSLVVLVGALGPTLVHRLELAVDEVRQYETTGHSDNSVGQRLAHWKAAWHMGLQRPLLGWTQAGYEQEKHRMVAAGEAPAAVLVYGHAHNEFLDVFAKRGLLGLFSVLGLYGSVLWLFWPRCDQALSPERQGLQLAALMMPLAYLGFGLTQAFLGHNSGTMFYLFMSLLMYGALRQPEPALPPPAPVHSTPAA